ncbi:MAG: SusC/RagA family TonB-linked outer membrane protein [Clostridium sp.]|nr:SusC/RagA family TonB-linked outer membrane protein [Bacteroides sp.]MCM1198466.1 SusC/RagA family TonB-linked outer membrane protein [Clostridium sp.]
MIRKHYFKTLGVLLALGLGSSGLSAQERVVSGTVHSTSSEPLVGATIVSSDSLHYTVSLSDGRYSISLPADRDYVLSCSTLGYRTASAIVTSGTFHYDFVLEEDVDMIEETVVIGYGTIRRGTLTNSVTTVSSEDFIEGAVTSPLQLLSGKVAGLAINTTSGNPNSDGVQMMLRGTSTLMSSGEPLIVIDGISGGSISNVTPDDIVSIDVLKDGSAAAIYGTRGNNGVILITTRRGQHQGEKSLTYHGYVSFDQISRQIEVLSPEEYVNLSELTQGAFSPLDAGARTDWGSLVLRNPVNQSHNLSLSGGTKGGSYYADLSVRTKDGIIRGSGLDRYNVSVGINQSLFEEKLKISANLGNVYAKGTNVSSDQAYLGTLTTNPTYPVMNEATGTYSMFANVPNPVKLINEFREDVSWTETMLNGKITYSPVRELTINAIGSFKHFYHFNGSYATKEFDQNGYDGQAWRNTSSNKTWTAELYAQWSKRISRHDITAMAGASYLAYTGQSLSVYNRDFPNDFFEYNNIGLGLALQDGNASMSSGKSMNRLASFFARVNYSYGDRYLFSASLREDGSSKFGPNNRWGTFWSASAAWRITKEKFMENLRWLDELKLKFSYGVTGVEPSSAYLSQLTYSYGAPVCIDGKWIYTATPSSMSNSNLKWEEKHEYNIGLDFAFLGNRLSGSLDFYSRQTKDLIYTYNVPMPPNVASTIYANVGSMTNNGVELSLSGKAVDTRNWKLMLAGNVSYNDNRISSLSNAMYKRDYLELGNAGGAIVSKTHIVQEGGHVGDFWGWESIGIKKNGSWLIADEGSYGSDSSRKIIGNGVPKVFAGFTLQLSYKNWDFSTSLRGAFCYQIINQYRMLYESFTAGQQMNFPKTILEKPYGGEYYIGTSTSPAYVSYFVENGDYVKIDNVTLGYNFRFKEGAKVKNLRLYLSGLNLLCFTGYKGIDPEVNFSGLTPGMDYSTTYPTVRTISFGVKLGL